MFHTHSFLRWLLCAMCGLCLAACGSDAPKAPDALQVDAQDAVWQRIVELRSKRDGNGNADIAAIKSYLAVDNKTHRYAAALVAASVQDTACIPDLVNLLRDESPEVRAMAVFALGQTHSQQAAVAMAAMFKKDSSALVRAAILENIGRCGDTTYFNFLAASNPYPLQDTALLIGQALGLHRYATRGAVRPQGTTRIINEFIANPVVNKKARRIAANYLARAAEVNLKEHEYVLINSVQEEEDVYTLAFLVVGLAKVQTSAALATLKEKFYQNPDHRVKCNILRGLRSYPYDSVKTVLFEGLRDSVNAHVPLVAAEQLYFMGKDGDAITYANLADAQSQWQVKAMLYAASLKNMAAYRTPNKSFISNKIMDLYKKSTQPYEKAAYARALGGFEWNYKFVAAELFPLSDTIVVHPIVKTALAEALVQMRSSENWDKVWGANKQRADDEMNGLLRRSVESGDVGLVNVVVELLINPRFNFRAVFPDYAFLREAQSKLSLPRDIETLYSLQSAINFFSNSKTDVAKQGKTALISPDWQMLGALGKNPRVLFATTKGTIVIELYPDDAPATVTQFINLIKGGFYTNKAFHRVVPSFVVQGGCTRGDGYGGYEKAVPSEFALRRFDAEGMVGMASAGKDTEGTQFFITLAPAIHLDGNYTLFGRVAQGMDVVHRLQVGDMIQSASLQQ